MSFETLTLFTLLTVYVCTAGARFGHLSPISLFIYAQTVMALGTLPMLVTGSAADAAHVELILGTYAVLTFSAFVYAYGLLRTPRKSYAPRVDYTYPKKTVWALIGISIAISVAYYLAVGYLALFESIRALLQGTDADLAGLRLESYAGSRYLYPGYVNQFKNSLLPALAIVAVVGAYSARTRGRGVMAVTLIATAILFLLGTGQRGAFVTSGILAAISAYLIAPKAAPKAVIRMAFVVVPVFFFSTFASGRAAQELDAAPNPLEAIGVMFNQLAFRLLGSNQLSSTVGFRYVYDLDIPFASEWARSIAGLLPGVAGSDLSNRVFEVLYGSTRGTAPLSIWGATYHNVGFIGTLVFAALLTLLLCWTSAKINALQETNIIQLVGAAGITVTFGVWIAGSPDTLLNGGLAVFVLLWWWGGRRAASASHRDSRELTPRGRVRPPRTVESWPSRTTP